MSKQRLRLTKYDKLVRDRVVAKIKRKGERVKYHTAVENETFIGYVVAKILEEGMEIAEAYKAVRASEAKSGREDRKARRKLLTEMADLEEAMVTLAALYGFTASDIEAMRVKRLEELGGFSQRIILDES